MAYAAIANGGTVYKPFFIEKVVTVEGKDVNLSSPQIQNKLPLATETMNRLKECLWEVVNTPTGTGTRAQIPGSDVCGKTGTAQVVSLNRGNASAQLNELQDHAWFVAFAPRDEAKIAVVVFVEHGGHGGSAAAPIAKTIISRFFELEAGSV
jgi:penicillin-binding protein 2